MDLGSIGDVVLRNGTMKSPATPVLSSKRFVKSQNLSAFLFSILDLAFFVAAAAAAGQS